MKTVRSRTGQDRIRQDRALHTQQVLTIMTVFVRFKDEAKRWVIEFTFSCLF